jgi:hypothetical protein
MRSRAGDGETAAVRLATGAALPDAVEVGDPDAWSALDEGVRRGGWCADGWLPAWERTEGGRALTDALRRAGGLGLASSARRAGRLTEPQLALALCHRDGRIRKAALEHVADHPGLLPLVVVRCADWAGPVRERARERLAELLDPPAAARVLPVALRVGRRDRGDFATALATDVLRRAPGEVRALCAAPDRLVRRFACRLAVAERLLAPAQLARVAARDDDTVVQSVCTQAALAAVTGDGGGDDVLAPLLAARSPRVRSSAVTVLRRAGRPREAEVFLADRSAVVRACARYVVRQYGTDPLPLYRSWCAAAGDPALPPGAVIGLAECGERADAELLWPLLAHPAARVRAQAVAGLRALDVADASRLWVLLDDPAPGVVREVTVALLPSARSLDAAWLTDRLAAGRPRHVRVAAFRLLDACGGIGRLRAAVALLEDPDEPLRSWAEQAVRRWYPAGDAASGTPEAAGVWHRGRRLLGRQVRKAGGPAG